MVVDYTFLITWENMGPMSAELHLAKPRLQHWFRHPAQKTWKKKKKEAPAPKAQKAENCRRSLGEGLHLRPLSPELAHRRVAFLNKSLLGAVLSGSLNAGLSLKGTGEKDFSKNNDNHTYEFQ